MKKRFQKIAALLLVGAMAGSLVTGCGGSKDTPTTGGTDERQKLTTALRKMTLLRRNPLLNQTAVLK